MKSICKQCKKQQFKLKRYRGNLQKFCSLKCYWIYRKEKKMYPPNRKGSKITEKHKASLRRWHKEHPEHNLKRRGHTPWNKGLKLINMRAENHPRWKGGHVKHPDKRIRKSAEYKEWRTRVFERDDFTCQFCKARGGKLQADHIKSFALYSNLRLILSNGRTLCVPCHKTTNNYGRPKPNIQ